MRDIDTAIAIVKAASAVPLRHFRQPLSVDAKPDDSPVTIADRKTEVEIRRLLAEAFPDDGIFGEEFGNSGTTNGRLWVIDPIDGTRSFISGNPLFGMLLALVEDGTPTLGVVGMPALGEVFAGGRDAPATLNGTPIRASAVTRLSDAVIYVNEGDRLHATHPDAFARLMQVGATRRFAYDCYPHALVAAGHVDCVVDLGLEPYDFLSLQPLIEAAGGVVADWHGNPLTLESDGRIVSAATSDLLHQMLDLLNS
jgi:inositol-phosphate phosphatase / L-galactose 1-phosphate phosphatase / histidinol-phosphatase